jgi:hypothetical protein
MKVIRSKLDTMKLFSLYVGTSAIALAEWMMFELLRTPCNPPDDMLTFLGTEKYALVFFMGAVAIMWAIALIWILATTRLTLQHYFGYMTLLAVLLAGFQHVVRYPPWPVTPWHLVWS